MAGEWTLIEYRPGRFAKISATGEFLGRASEAEAKAWFAAREAPLDLLLKAETVPEAPPVGRETVSATPVTEPHPVTLPQEEPSPEPPDDVPEADLEVTPQAMEGEATLDQQEDEENTENDRQATDIVFGQLEETVSLAKPGGKQTQVV